MTGVQPLGSSNMRQAIEKLLDKGCNTVILTLGEYGAAYASQADRTIKLISTTPVQPVDTTVRLPIALETSPLFSLLLLAITILSAASKKKCFHFETLFQCSLEARSPGTFKFTIFFSRVSAAERTCIRARQLIYELKGRRCVESYR